MNTRDKKGRAVPDDSVPQLAFAQPGLEKMNAEKTDPLRMHKIIRIAVSGDVLLTKLEVALIDTPEFQRLRRVRQLGNVLMVFPTALHTRFDHSLGTLAMADRMVRAIKSNTHNGPEEKTITEDEELLVRLYALLHDITHIPYGHTLEDELVLFQRHDKNIKRIDRFIGPASTIGKLITAELGAPMYDRLMRIFKWDGQDSAIGNDAFIYDLVSNTVCADLLDYLKRDSYFCNLAVTFEERFLNFLYLQPDHGLRRVFVRLWKKNKPTPRRDTLSDLVALLQARYVIAERAYFHHAKMISGAMLGRALQEAQLATLLSEDDMYSHTDDTLLIWLSQCSAKVSQRLAKALLDRSLHKMVHTYTESDFAGVQDHDYEHDAVNDAVGRLASPTDRLALENRLAEEIEAQPGDVLIYAPERDMNMKAAKMRVLWKGEPRPFEEIDDPVTKPRLEQILKAHRMLWGIHIIGSPGLTLEQQSLIRRACDIEFIAPVRKQQQARVEYYEALVERSLKSSNAKLDMGARDYAERRHNAAEELSIPALDRRAWSGRLDAVIKKHFSIGESRDSKSQS